MRDIGSANRARTTGKVGLVTGNTPKDIVDVLNIAPISVFKPAIDGVVITKELYTNLPDLAS
jgi:hypothetical protein